MNCFFCKGELTDGTTTHVVTLEKCIIIVKNVPCTTCKQCGESFFSTEVVQQLEKIVEAVKHSIMSEVAIVEYSRAVA